MAADKKARGPSRVDKHVCNELPGFEPGPLGRNAVGLPPVPLPHKIARSDKLDNKVFSFISDGRRIMEPNLRGSRHSKPLSLMENKLNVRQTKLRIVRILWRPTMVQFRLFVNSSPDNSSPRSLKDPTCLNPQSAVLTSGIKIKIKILGNAENRTQGCWVKSKYI